MRGSGYIHEDISRPDQLGEKGPPEWRWPHQCHGVPGWNNRVKRKKAEDWYFLSAARLP